MSEKASHLYVPDYQAWENFYTKRASDQHQKVGFGFETEKEALKHQQEEGVVSAERVKICDQGKAEPKIISVFSPTEQTLQQAESAMKKAGAKVKSKRSSSSSCKKRCSGGRKGKTSRPKKAKLKRKGEGRKQNVPSVIELLVTFSANVNNINLLIEVLN